MYEEIGLNLGIPEDTIHEDAVDVGIYSTTYDDIPHDEVKSDKIPMYKSELILIGIGNRIYQDIWERAMNMCQGYQIHIFAPEKC